MQNKPSRQFLGQPRLWWLSLLFTVWWGGMAVIMALGDPERRPPWWVIALDMALSLLNSTGLWLFFRRGPKRR